MFQRPVELERRLGRKQTNVIGSMFYILMKKCNLSYSEIKAMPVPMAMALLNEIKKENKEKEKAYKKSKRRKR